MIVSTERLVWPGAESTRLERAGIAQHPLIYPDRPDEPSATCHVQPSVEEAALCGYPWEMLIAIPGSPRFDELDDRLQCSNCNRIIASRVA